MPMPKSVTKISKKGVTFTSSVDKVNYTIEELTRRALKDVGRFISYTCSQKVNSINSLKNVPYKRRKFFGKSYQYWVRKKEMDLQVGVHNTKYTDKYTWFGGDAELGTNGQPKRAILTESVRENIDKIREIEAQYLSAVDDELKAQALIDEAEAQGDADDYK